MSLRRFSSVGLTMSDALIGLSVVALLAALLYPTLRGRAIRSLIENTAAEVETMRSAALGVYSRDGDWPASVAPGAIPAQLAGAFSPDSTLVRDDYTLQWNRWEVVEQVPAAPAATRIPADADAPPDSVGPRLISVMRGVGAIVVHSGNDALLAELFARYGPEVSFVRDTMWTLTFEPGDATSSR